MRARPKKIVNFCDEATVIELNKFASDVRFGSGASHNRSLDDEMGRDLYHRCSDFGFSFYLALVLGRCDLILTSTLSGNRRFVR